MNVLLVEPKSRRTTHNIREYLDKDQNRKIRDNSLWYPPLGLMKLSSFHKQRGDYVEFVYGLDPKYINRNPLQSKIWDRVYITTLFTYNWNEVINTINFYLKAVNGKFDRIFVGGIMASLMADEIFEETNIYPIKGIINSPTRIGLTGNENIDLMPPDYSLFENHNYPYAINETYYAYTSRGCVNKCGWCGVPKIEPRYVPYIDIKDTIVKMRDKYGDKPILKLMDNNILASPRLHKIVDDLISLGYGRGSYTNTKTKRERVIDFNQGLDASFFSNDKIKLISALNIRPMRIAFDKISEKKEYIRALEAAKEYGFTHFSNYILYNWHDTPRDLYERLVINIKMNEKWRTERKGHSKLAKIFCYPMRYAPIHNGKGENENRERDLFKNRSMHSKDLLNSSFWTRRFTRNIEIMKGAFSGAISSTPSVALRTIGANYEEFIANLYMPSELLRNRNKYEKKVYKDEPGRVSGTGEIEKFRKFIMQLIKDQSERLIFFHDAVSPNQKQRIRRAIIECKDKEILMWLKYYLL